MHKLFNENYRKDFSPQLKKLTIPAIITHAHLDNLYSPDYIKKYASYIKKSTIVSVRGTHDWPILTPKEIVNYIEGCV